MGPPSEPNGPTPTEHQARGLAPTKSPLCLSEKRTPQTQPQWVLASAIPTPGDVTGQRGELGKRPSSICPTSSIFVHGGRERGLPLLNPAPPPHQNDQDSGEELFKQRGTAPTANTFHSGKLRRSKLPFPWLGSRSYHFYFPNLKKSLGGVPFAHALPMLIRSPGHRKPQKQKYLSSPGGFGRLCSGAWKYGSVHLFLRCQRASIPRPQKTALIKGCTGSRALLRFCSDIEGMSRRKGREGAINFTPDSQEQELEPPARRR